MSGPLPGPLPGLTLVLGGARSGKSRYAEQIVCACPPPWIYIATGEAKDAGMQARIAEHQARRGSGWRTLETPLDLAGALRSEAAAGPVLADCLTLWLANLLLAGRDPVRETEDLAGALAARAAAGARPCVLVSNEVGLGLVPETPLGRVFRDHAGRLHQRMAALAERVVLMVAGCPVTVKAPVHAGAGQESLPGPPFPELSPEEAGRHRRKMAKRKAVQDAEVAGKTREKGLLLVHTGKGKGKSTAAFGLVLRVLGHGGRAGVVQFVKGAWETGEKAAFARFGGQVSWHTMGEGFTWETQDRARDMAAARRAFAKAQDLMADPEIRLLVLDELNIVLRYGLLPEEEVLAVLAARREELHIVVTGRNAPPALLALADGVTEMAAVKHHFAAGIKAQAGIEF